ncbi:hypothetical protein [Micromonospora auratinigra]|uniref:PH domain-containing protein n=1 Tax=Micromonospora auratinigra TaxID=261654 RepID=A0A1A9AAN5_9ACTN|nr:hypothetical protein [Micromonospora auratinigra]SBT53547.1 hypothetical protein GA0070611_6179 [Micromonospora auratinigra]
MSEVRARYTYRPMLPVYLIGFAFPVVCPIIWWKAGLLGLPGWAVPLIILVVAPPAWAWLLFRVVHRLELTDDTLRMRATLASVRVPLAELREIRMSGGGNMGRVVFGRNRRRTLMQGVGLIAFLEQVRQAAPQARIPISDHQRFQERGIARLTMDTPDGR